MPPETGNLESSTFRERLTNLARERAGEVEGLIDDLGLVAVALDEHLGERREAASENGETPPEPALAGTQYRIIDGGFVRMVGGDEAEIPHRLFNFTSGVEIRTGEPVERVEQGRVFARGAAYEADVIVADLDADRLESLLSAARHSVAKRLIPSGVAMYGVLKETLPDGIPNRNTVLPEDTGAFFASLQEGEEPDQSVVFLNHYRPGEVYPNEKGTLTLQLAVPASGREYGLDDPLVEREMRRVERALGLPRPLDGYIGDHFLLDPAYFAEWGSGGGAMYGAVRPFWQIGLLHRPPYSERKRPWLWRVGASVHPGGGVPAVLSGAMISMGRLLEKLGF